MKLKRRRIEIKIELLRYPTEEDWKRCLNLARMTQGKGEAPKAPSYEWKMKILKAEHSPIRTLMFTILIEDVPYYSAMHFARHKFGVEHYVQSQRSDVNRSERKQGDTVNYIMDLNAQALINMAKKRLCHKADSVTRSIMMLIKCEVVEKCPEFKPFIIPQCGCIETFCPEFTPCGHYRMKSSYEQYIEDKKNG